MNDEVIDQRTREFLGAMFGPKTSPAPRRGEAATEDGGRAEHMWKPGDNARVVFGDGVRRPAQLTPGFIWSTADSAHNLAAEGGFDAAPLVAPCAEDGISEAVARAVRSVLQALEELGPHRVDATDDVTDAVMLALPEVAELRGQVERVRAACSCASIGCPCGGDRAAVDVAEIRAALASSSATEPGSAS